MHMRIIKNYIVSTFYFVVIIINIAVVTIVYYYNYTTVRELVKTSSLSPQKLCQELYESHRKPPEAFTYDQLPDNKYVIYKLDRNDMLYHRLVEDYPVDIDGHQWIPNNEENSKITYTKTGFTVPGIPNELACPFRWYWDQKQSKCVESPLCPRFNNSILPLLNAYYTEITNPATTMLTKLTDKVIHKKLYIQCMRNERKPMIKACSENTFVKMSTEKFDENKITHIPPLKNREPDVDALCKRYDVCEHRLNGSVHRLLINDSDGPLEADEYYICKKGTSVKKKCKLNYKVDLNLDPNSGHICVPISQCDHGRDFYFGINNDAFGYCKANVEYIKSCDGNGIFNMPDGSIECRAEECLNPTVIMTPAVDPFHYPIGIKSCFGGNALKVLTCDQLFNKLTPGSQHKNIYIPPTKIIYQSVRHSNSKEYYEDAKIMLPTTFYYDEEKGECVPFKQEGIKKFLVDMKMIKTKARIYKSTTEAIESLPFNLITDQMLLDPTEFRYKRDQQIYAVYNGKIYRTDDNLNGIEWGNSKNYYSFIYPIAKTPKKIGKEIQIVNKLYDETDGIYYVLCIKYHKKLKLSNLDVTRIGLNEFEDIYGTDASHNLTEHKIDYDVLESKFGLQKNLLKDNFSWDKLYVGKYYYDKKNECFIIWHDYLFVIQVKDLQKLIPVRIDDNVQLLKDIFPWNIPSIIYDNNNKELGNWHETALVTTFNYAKKYYDEPVPFWFSFIDLSLEELSEENIFNYFRIVYPECKNYTIEKNILLSIIKLKPLTVEIKGVGNVI